MLSFVSSREFCEMLRTTILQSISEQLILQNVLFLREISCCCNIVYHEFCCIAVVWKKFKIKWCILQNHASKTYRPFLETASVCPWKSFNCSIVKNLLLKDDLIFKLNSMWYIYFLSSLTAIMCHIFYRMENR